MTPELRTLVDHSVYYQEAIRKVGELLPKDDAELDALVAEIVAGHDQDAFVFVVVAALDAGRRVDARHLEHGTVLMPNGGLLGCIAMHLDGDVGEFLLKAVLGSRLWGELNASALWVLAMWCKEHRNGDMPKELVSEARLFARSVKQLHLDAAKMMMSLAIQLNDAALLKILGMTPDKIDETARAVWHSFAQVHLEMWRKPIIQNVPAERPRTIVTGGPMRRAVERIGRNDPCPCGSGRKYKRCCLEKDQERLRHSSDVAGKTKAELKEEMEPHLTEERIGKLYPHELLHLDPVKVPRDLLTVYFLQMCGYRLLDRVTEAFEKVVWGEDLKKAWDIAMTAAGRDQRRDIALRLKAVRDHEDGEITVDPTVWLLLEGGDPGAFLKALDQVCMEALQREQEKPSEEIACGILQSPAKALGIFVARSFIPLISKRKAVDLMELILKTRDKLNLPPDDPFGDVLEKRFADEVVVKGKDAGAMRAAQRKLEDKAGEVRRLKASVEQLQHEIDRQERETQHASPAPVFEAGDESRLRELRMKVEEFKGLLKERNQERTDLRKELQQTYVELQNVRQNQSAALPAETDHEHDVDEENLILPGEAACNQPPRLISFPPKFQEVLTSFPRPLTRATLIMLGRLAAGEQGAFAGVVRLKAFPDVLRQRIGRDHRLLFRLLPECVQVVDLINRRDLEKRIKTLLLGSLARPQT